MPVAVVTGAGRGLGAAIADRLERDGFDVVRLDRTADAPGVVACDVRVRAEVDAVAERVGPVDVLVNNAGIWRFGPLEAVDPAEFAEVVDVNLLGTFHCTQAFGRPMLDRGGAIVNIVSIAAAAANPQVGAYSASKAAVVALTRQTALEWGPRGVRANAVGPGLVPTPGTGTVYDDPEVRAVRAGAVPVGRLATPDDVAAAVAFLVSGEASYVSGQVLYVDGGLGQALMTLLPRPAGVAGPHLAGPLGVVRRHLAAVGRGDRTGMSADYALDAVLRRGPDRYEGREAIAAYFATVPDRLGGRTVGFGEPVETGEGRVEVAWRIEGGPAPITGRDRFVVRDGWIAEQEVHLDGGDF